MNVFKPSIQKIPNADKVKPINPLMNINKNGLKINNEVEDINIFNNDNIKLLLAKILPKWSAINLIKFSSTLNLYDAKDDNGIDVTPWAELFIKFSKTI